MTTNEKRRAMTYLAGRILSYKEYDKMGYKETAMKTLAIMRNKRTTLPMSFTK